MDMEETSSGGKSIELLQNAIEQLTEFRKTKLLLGSDEIEGKTESESEISPTANGNGDEIQIITKLISQLESLKEDGAIKQTESTTEANEEPPSAINATRTTGAEEIVEELRNVKNQNRITHLLLSGMIFLTVVWQLSEVSIILKFRDGLNHPFRSLWSFVKRMVKGPSAKGQDTEKQESLSSSIKDTLVESASLPLKLTEISQMDLELPCMQLPSLVSGQDK